MRSLSDKNRSIEAMFSNISPHYDALNHLLSLGIDKYWRKRLIDKIPDEAERILDIATGTGDVALKTSKKHKNLIVGLDISLPMLQAAARKDKNHNIHLINAQAEYLPFRDSSFDIVTIAFGIRNVPDKIKALNEMKRVIKNRGKLLILEFSHIRNIIWRSVFEFYFTRILPFIGNKISRNNSAYSYLPESVLNFPTCENFAELLIGAGFANVSYDIFLGGIAAIHTAEVKKDGNFV